MNPIRAAVSWSEAEFTQLVNATLKQVHSVLALARSPLADSSLVTPLLVLDDVSPTAGDRGQALRLVLQWAVEQLAPGPVAYPLGSYRPLDDPTWRDPPWWRYNILRHRYLEPLHPDDFVEGGRATETLLGLTGIPSPDTFFDERNRAIREVAQWLRQQLETGQADEELRELALAEAYRPLQAHPSANALLEIAATLQEVFPRTLLLQMAAAEHVPTVDEALEHLTQHRFLQVGEEAQNLWMAPVLRRFLYLRQGRSQLLARHRRAAAYYQAENAPLIAARHLQQAQQWREAAALLLARAADLVDELQVDELIQVLRAFKRSHLPPDPWRDVQLLLGDLYRISGRQADALAACRLALKVADTPALQARIYRRMGKLYEQHNQPHALGYYEQAEERFRRDAPNYDPDYVDLLKDRAWLYILRQQWAQAEADLTQALALIPAAAHALRADIDDALASLFRHQRGYDQAIAFARAALALREETGDLLRVAKSFNNLGLIYNDMGDYGHAIAAYREAIATYTSLGNRELVAGALLNIGLAHHLDGRLAPAVQAYRECLTLCHTIGLPLVEARAHSNLAEALADLAQAGTEQTDPAQLAAARRHWQIGYDLSLRAGFDEEVTYYRQLLQQIPALAPPESVSAVDAPAKDGPPAVRPDANGAVPLLIPAPGGLPPDGQEVVDLARHEGRLTPRRVMAALGVSKATATRRLADLAAQGHLRRYGEGRGTYYAPAAAASEPPEEDTLRARLYQQIPQVQSTHGLTGLGILEGPKGPLRLVARFRVLPDLAAFFRLEADLAQILERAVDLVPEALWAQRDEPVPVVAWVWLGQEFQG